MEIAGIEGQRVFPHAGVGQKRKKKERMFPLSRAGVAGTDWDSSPINVPATNIRE
jgi:hypothetical protein